MLPESPEATQPSAMGLWGVFTMTSGYCFILRLGLCDQSCFKCLMAFCESKVPIDVKILPTHFTGLLEASGTFLRCPEGSSAPHPPALLLSLPTGADPVKRNLLLAFGVGGHVSAVRTPHPEACNGEGGAGTKEKATVGPWVVKAWLQVASQGVAGSGLSSSPMAQQSGSAAPHQRGSPRDP